MEQEKSFNEKEYLMFRIKDKYCSNPKLLKWIVIISVVLAVVVAVVTLLSGSFLHESNTVILFLLLATTNYLGLKFGQKIEPMTDPQEVISEYDRHNRRSWRLLPLFFVAYLLSVVFMKEDLVMAAIIFGAIVLLIVIFLLLGVGKDTDIERLRELVKQEDKEKSGDLATY